MFRLRVYSALVKSFLAGQDNLRRIIEDGSMRSKSIEQMIKEEWINSQWIYFMAWYKKRDWGIFKKKLVFRGLFEYSQDELSRILRKGNDRVYDVNLPENNPTTKFIIERYKINPEDFIFAGDLRESWITANAKLGINDGERIVLIYNKRLLRNDLGTNHFAYRLKRGVPSFKNALIGVIIIEYC